MMERKEARKRRVKDPFIKIYLLRRQVQARGSGLPEDIFAPLPFSGGGKGKKIIPPKGGRYA